MGTRIKTFDSTGTAPNGRLYAGDLNAIQDQYADLTNLAQTHAVGTLQVGETGLQIVRFGAGEMRITGALRTDGILRGLGGLFAGTFTTTQRNAITSPPYGLIILNTTTNQLEWNAGTPSVPNWQSIAPAAGTIGTSGIADGAVTSQKIADGTVAYVDLSAALKPSGSAVATDEALRSLIATINTQSSNYTLVIGDIGKIVEMNLAGVNTVTIPPNSSVAFPVGTVITITQLGAGQTTIVAGAGVTLRSNPGNKINGQYGMATLYKRATDEWVLSGNTTP